MRHQLSQLLSTLILLIIGSYATALNLLEEKYQNVDFVVVEVSSNESLKLFWKNPITDEPYRSLSNLSSTLKKQNENVLFAINSGIFSQDKIPLGLHIEDSIRLQALNQVTRKDAVGNFSLVPNGVFWVDSDGHNYVEETESFLANREKHHPVYATQSGPMLIINGELHYKFFAESDSLKYRSGVCVVNDKTYFVVTQSPINFYYFASFFKDQLKCQNALYLDGTLSQLLYRGRAYGASYWNIRPYVGIWAVIE